MAVRGLHHVQVAAPEGSESEVRRFFGDVMGLTEIPKPAHLAVRGGVWFDCGAQQLHVGMDAEFHPAWKSHPAFLVSDLSALRKRLFEAGAEVFDDLPLPGFRRFYARDPFGNRLEFVEPENAPTR
ncbi:MAG TPA: VOC family protein [Thermoplasmata archaeon]|nr:VOC family protein [Thermoplasmata archaeon]